ncbi:MAG TPA: histidine phosphatase family protein, partial [Caulobacteraceae bacterium]|nr:histidine phosphatase family protein [Caulobacteraceae bacterium]
ARRSGHCEGPPPPRHPDPDMSRVYLIRHAKPSATWGGDDDDPGLDDLGRSQAKSAAEALLALPPEHRPTRVVSSPLRRCQETATPFAQAIGAVLEIDPAVGEIPSPAALPPEERGPWLRHAFGGTWAEIKGDLDYDAWRGEVVRAVASREHAAVFSHFVAINAVLTALAGEPQVITLRPDHASISVLELTGGVLSVLERGRVAPTQVL